MIVRVFLRVIGNVLGIPDVSRPEGAGARLAQPSSLSPKKASLVTEGHVVRECSCYRKQV